MKTRIRLALALCALCPLAPLALRAADPTPPAAADEPTPHQKLYYFEHRLMPKWTHETDGAFYAALRSGNVERLREVATKLGGADFAEKLAVENIDSPQGVLIAFAAPTDVPECFDVFVAKTGESYRYFTFEKAKDILGEGLVACIGEWTADGDHRNFGFSKESSREAFLTAVTDLLRDPETSPGAVTHPQSAPAE